ncbi:uncharacterized protein LOC127256748 [Andrographis paniculata]|uniref:uncharacterized protein LOC127256748 n=1 Tax=Andrographis paniculata TaxID=175694 RepID=UPI0021E83E29|nr:uncharacterized protein LOC127256748 [Andrographis paniculata]
MATTVLKTPPSFTSPATCAASPVRFHNFPRVSFAPSKLSLIRCRIRRGNHNRSSVSFSGRSFHKLLTFAADGEAAGTQTDTQEKDPAQESESETAFEGKSDDEDYVDASSESDESEEPTSVIKPFLVLYKEALANNDKSKIAEIESVFKSIEDEKNELERKVVALSEELSYEKDRVLRISADFDNFRKRTERDRLSLVTNARGEVVESLLPVLDNFERARTQIKVETEGEEKVNNSYQSIYKQFGEILTSLGVVPVEPVGKPFDPMLHEAIMREESTEYKDGIIIEEFRKGFQLGERLLRPSMVKVSSGPGPADSEPEDTSNEQKDADETAPDEE